MLTTAYYLLLRKRNIAGKPSKMDINAKIFDKALIQPLTGSKVGSRDRGA